MNEQTPQRLTRSYHEPSLSTYVLVSIEGPVAATETTGYSILHTFSAAAQVHSNIRHMTQTHLICNSCSLGDKELWQ